MTMEMRAYLPKIVDSQKILWVVLYFEIRDAYKIGYYVLVVMLVANLVAYNKIIRLKIIPNFMEQAISVSKKVAVINKYR